MNRISRRSAAFSKASLKPGDTLRYRVADDGIRPDTATEAGNDPFAVFSEWTSEADERAYKGL